VVNGPPVPVPVPGADADPVLARRAQIARVVQVAQRIGYLCLGLAVVAFIVAFATDFPTWLVTLTVALLVAAIVILPLPIIFGYGVRAAEREERGGGSFH
jgi:hypothetical protein